MFPPRPCQLLATPESGDLPAPSVAPTARRAPLPDAPASRPALQHFHQGCHGVLGIWLHVSFFFPFLNGHCHSLSYGFPRIGHHCGDLPATRRNKEGGNSGSSRLGTFYCLVFARYRITLCSSVRPALLSRQPLLSPRLTAKQSPGN